jgi:hypothetical protein
MVSPISSPNGVMLTDSTDGSIKVDYGYTNRPGGQSKTFHTRQLTFPILFTVYHTFEPHSLDIVRFQPNSKGSKRTKSSSLLPPPTPRRTSFAKTADDSLQKKLQDEADDEHCLVSLGVRNVHGVPFEVTLERTGDGSGELSLLQASTMIGYQLIIDDSLTTSRLIPPGSTER